MFVKQAEAEKRWQVLLWSLREPREAVHASHSRFMNLLPKAQFPGHCSLQVDSIAPGRRSCNRCVRLIRSGKLQFQSCDEAHEAPAVTRRRPSKTKEK